MAVSIKELLDSAARKIGILAGGGAELEADEYADALGALRGMLDAWSLEDLMIPFQPTESFALESDRNFYSMGEAGDWDTIRPEQVLVVRIEGPDARRYPVRETSLQTLQHIPTLVVARPRLYAVNRDARFVYVEFDAYPEAGTRALITSLKPFNATALDAFDTAYDPDAEPVDLPASGFTLTGIQSAIEFPSGYQQCLVYNLAIHLAAEYGKTIPDEVVAIAGNTKRLVKRRNTRAMVTRVDPAAHARGHRVGGYDINGGPVR